MSHNQTIDSVPRELLERISSRLNDTGQFLLSEELHAALTESAPIIGGEVARLNGMLDAASELLRTKQRVNRELRSELERIKAINGNNFKPVLDRLFEPVAPVVEGQDDQQMACMPVERCNDVRTKMIIAFNEEKKAGGDLDDALNAAYKSALRYSPNSLNAAQPQGEPVAWQHRVTAGPQTGWSLWAPGRGKEYAEHYTVEVRPLYAEQPAPVAVPERLVMTDGLHTYEYVTGHNAAIDKMLGVKP